MYCSLRGQVKYETPLGECKELVEYITSCNPCTFLGFLFNIGGTQLRGVFCIEIPGLNLHCAAPCIVLLHSNFPSAKCQQIITVAFYTRFAKERYIKSKATEN